MPHPALRRGDNMWTRAALLPLQTLVASKNVETIGLGWSDACMIMLDVQSAANAAGDKLDVYIDVSPDNGTTWANLLRFPQVLGNGGAKKFWSFIAPSTGETTTFDVTTDAAAGVVRQLGTTDSLRARVVITGTTPSFSAQVLGFFKG